MKSSNSLSKIGRHFANAHNIAISIDKPSVEMSAVWLQALGADDHDHCELLIAQLIPELAYFSRELDAISPPMRDNYRGPIIRLRRALLHAHDWDHTDFLDRINADFISHVYTLARAGDPFFRHIHITPDELLALRQTLNELVEIALDSNLATDFKAAFIRSLRLLIQALDTYELAGSAPLDRSLDIAFATVIRHSSHFEDPQYDIAETLFSPFEHIITTLESAFSHEPTLPKLLMSLFTKLIEGPKQ